MRRRFSPEVEEQAVARSSAPGAPWSGVAKELGVTQVLTKTARLELMAAGSAEAVLGQRDEGTALSDLRRENRPHQGAP